MRYVRRRLPTAMLAGAIVSAFAFGCAEQSEHETSATTGQPAPEQAPPAEDPPPAPSAEQNTAMARTLFLNNCAPCHGRGGAGDGPMAAMLPETPRSLLDDEWRFIDPSTPDDVEDIMFIVRRGVPESGMNGFENVLTEEEIEQVVRYVLDLRAAAQE